MSYRKGAGFVLGTAWATIAALGLGAASNASPRGGVLLTGELRTWHRVTLTLAGPQAREDGAVNPFLDYRLTVVFTNGARSYVVPGFFAADGNAAETGATAGNRWRVHFAPDAAGTWRFTVFFRSGPGVAIDDSPGPGRAAPPDGLTGAFEVAPSDKGGRDHRGKGRLAYVGRRHLVFSETGEPFLKGGADSPENFLAYAGFDGGGRHRYEPHVRDWRPGDPVWRGGQGQGIIGALNYLATRGMNSVYFLTMNVGGDGKDVWPWVSPLERLRYDCSKLDQWEVVFSHMDALGLALHVVQQETENDHLLDGGALGPERRLYYRELIARFAHHLALVWNLGEENRNSEGERKSFARWIRGLDPYHHPIVVHTSVARKEQERAIAPLLGFDAIEGPSLQIGDVTRVHEETLRWVERSARTTRPWVVPIDEIGPAARGVLQDVEDARHDAERTHALWGNLMAGGAGAEWYLGSREVPAPDGSFARRWWDLEAEDWRAWEGMWDQTRHALDFFREHLPFTEMESADALTSVPESYALAKPGQVYAVYLWSRGATDLDLGPYAHEYEVLWYDPRSGGPLQKGSLDRVSGPGWRSIGIPPSEPGRDWAALVRWTGKDGGQR
jgi:hypothetical protein